METWFACQQSKGTMATCYWKQFGINFNNDRVNKTKNKVRRESAQVCFF